VSLPLIQPSLDSAIYLTKLTLKSKIQESMPANQPLRPLDPFLILGRLSSYQFFNNSVKFIKETIGDVCSKDLWGDVAKAF
jgi:hypothetical protein